MFIDPLLRQESPTSVFFFKSVDSPGSGSNSSSLKNSFAKLSAVPEIDMALELSLSSEFDRSTPVSTMDALLSLSDKVDQLEDILQDMALEDAAAGDLEVQFPDVPAEEPPIERLQYEVSWLQTELQALLSHLVLLEAKTVNTHFSLKSNDQRYEVKKGKGGMNKVRRYRSDVVQSQRVEVLDNLREELQNELNSTMEFRELSKSRNDKLEALLKMHPDDMALTSPSTAKLLRSLTPLPSPRLEFFEMSQAALENGYLDLDKWPKGAKLGGNNMVGFEGEEVSPSPSSSTQWGLDSPSFLLGDDEWDKGAPPQFSLPLSKHQPSKSDAYELLSESPGSHPWDIDKASLVRTSSVDPLTASSASSSFGPHHLPGFQSPPTRFLPSSSNETKSSPSPTREPSSASKSPSPAGGSRRGGTRFGGRLAGMLSGGKSAVSSDAGEASPMGSNETLLSSQPRQPRRTSSRKSLDRAPSFGASVAEEGEDKEEEGGKKGDRSTRRRRSISDLLKLGSGEEKAKEKTSGGPRSGVLVPHHAPSSSLGEPIAGLAAGERQREKTKGGRPRPNSLGAMVYSSSSARDAPLSASLLVAKRGAAGEDCGEAAVGPWEKLEPEGEEGAALRAPPSASRNPTHQRQAVLLPPSQLAPAGTFAGRPNELAEEILRCIASVYERLAMRSPPATPATSAAAGHATSALGSATPSAPLSSRRSSGFKQAFAGFNKRGSGMVAASGPLTPSQAPLAPPGDLYPDSPSESPVIVSHHHWPPPASSPSAPPVPVNGLSSVVLQPTERASPPPPASGSLLASLGLRRTASASLNPDTSSGGPGVFVVECSREDPYGVLRELPCGSAGDYVDMLVAAMPAKAENRDGADVVALCRYRTLVEQLETVDPSRLSHDQRLAFWINLFNSLLMHTYLVNGQPHTLSKRVSLMAKATYRVGSNSISALDIEQSILRCCSHRSTQVAGGSHAAMRLLGGKKSSSSARMPIVNRFELSDERSKWTLQRPEPDVSFALCPGSHSGPALRVYSATQVREELEHAKMMFLMASVGVSKFGKILLPKILEWYWRDFVPDEGKLAEWSANQLPEPQKGALLDFIFNNKRQGVTKVFEMIPYDWSFRYLVEPYLGRSPRPRRSVSAFS